MRQRRLLLLRPLRRHLRQQLLPMRALLPASEQRLRRLLLMRALRLRLQLPTDAAVSGDAFLTRRYTRAQLTANSRLLAQVPTQRRAI
jgi:hypothetical protein